MSQRAGAALAEPRGLERGQLAQPWSRSDLAGPLRGARRGAPPGAGSRDERRPPGGCER